MAALPIPIPVGMSAMDQPNEGDLWWTKYQTFVDKTWVRRKEWEGSEREKEYMRSESAKVALARALISKTIADEPKSSNTPHDASQNGNNPSRSSQARHF